MKDDRTKREKLEAWLAPGSGKEESEKKIARAWLAAHPAPPKPPLRSWPGVDYEPPTGEHARPAGRQARAYGVPIYHYSDDDVTWVDNDFFDGASFGSFRRASEDMTERMRSFEQELMAAFSKPEQDAIHEYMEGKINQATLKERRGDPDGTQE